MNKQFPESKSLSILCTRIWFIFPEKSGSLLQNQEGLADLFNEEAYIFKLHIFGVEITTCSFQHIDKSKDIV